MSAASNALDGKRVLLMEDDMVLGLEVVMTLEDAGAAVDGPVPELSDGMERLDGALAGGDLPDAAVLDVELHDATVFPLAERLKAAGVPFVFYTARASSGNTQAWQDEAPVVSKGLGSHALLERLAEEVGVKS